MMEPVFSFGDLGNRLREIRISLGFGGPRQLREFCREHKLNASIWGLLERGVKPEMYVSSLVKYSVQFDRNPSYLLFGLGPMRLSDLPKTAMARHLPLKTIAKEMTGDVTEQIQERSGTYGLASGSLPQKTESDKTRSASSDTSRRNKGSQK